MATPKDVEAGMMGSPPPAYDQPGDSDRQHVNTDIPPTYSATMPSGDMAPPPSYESLYGKVKRARQETDGNVDFCRKVLILFCSTIGCTIVLGVMLAIPISMIVIGAVYKNDCPAERMIPIYLIVGGAFSIVKNLSTLGQRCKNRDDEDADEQNVKPNPFDGILSCFLFAWFIAGNVWIYRTYNAWKSDPNDPNFCDPTLYWYAFWITTATYILLGFTCFCVCCVGIVSACCGVFTKS